MRWEDGSVAQNVKSERWVEDLVIIMEISEDRCCGLQGSVVVVE